MVEKKQKDGRKMTGARKMSGAEEDSRYYEK